ncbi:amino acid permease family protein [Actinidia rufa]|uniref:Amino acid permease family protein n=1 Tax=Actinidia rufa TaxID=165716 RepID=A0A7J0F9E1_9ERIC|nr:amino acid permease family protein [Actinidia rufa]
MPVKAETDGPDSERRSPIGVPGAREVADQVGGIAEPGPSQNGHADDDQIRFWRVLVEIDQAKYSTSPKARRRQHFGSGRAHMSTLMVALMSSVEMTWRGSMLNVGLVSPRSRGFGDKQPLERSRATSSVKALGRQDGGYVVWVSSALGDYWGFQQGWMKWLSGVIDNALYPVLFLDYLKSAIPALAGGMPRVGATLGLTAVLTYMNFRGLTIVGWVAVLLGALSLLPFAVMGLIAIPKLRPSRCTLVGEVHNPKKTLPKALFYALILVVCGYFFPLLIGTGAIPLDRDLWSDGYFSDIAKMVGGVWLRFWIQGAAAMSNMGMFVAEMSSDSFQLLGMAERGMLPEFFAKRSRYGTPPVGILFSASGVILLSWLSFQEIVAAENFLYCFGMILEFIAFVRLRMKYPAASRPYKIPVGTVGSVLFLAAVVIGLVMQPCLKHVEKKKWLKFSECPDLPNLHGTAHENTESLID